MFQLLKIQAEVECIVSQQLFHITGFSICFLPVTETRNSTDLYVTDHAYQIKTF